MDNTYQPPGGDPQDRQPTEQFWPLNSPAAGHDPYGAGYGPPPGYGAGAGRGYQPPQRPGIGEHYERDRRRALRWTVGIAAAALLAGGIITGVALSGNAASAGSSGAGPTGQAAALSATLSSADSPSTASPTPSATSTGSSSAAAGTAAAPAKRCAKAAAAARAAGHPRAAQALAGHCRAFRLRVARLFGGIDGQFTFQTKKGPRTLAFERGVIETVSSGSNIVVRASDGTTWTWDLVSNTVVREKGAKTAQTALASGQPVWVGGPVNSGTKDARLIVIRPPASSSPASPSASPSS
jgi:hypothetical protein